MRDIPGVQFLRVDLLDTGLMDAPPDTPIFFYRPSSGAQMARVSRGVFAEGFPHTDPCTSGSARLHAIHPEESATSGGHRPCRLWRPELGHSETWQVVIRLGHYALRPGRSSYAQRPGTIPRGHVFAVISATLLTRYQWRGRGISSQGSPLSSSFAVRCGGVGALRRGS